MMEDIADAAKEQAEGVTNITIAMNELDKTTHLNSETAEETSNCSIVLDNQTNNLKDSVYRLNEQVHGKGSNVSSLYSKTTAPSDVVGNSTNNEVNDSKSDDIPSSDDERFNQSA